MQSSEVAPLFQTVLHCPPQKKLAIDSGSRAANALIAHYIWRFHCFETQEEWGVGIQSIR